MIRYEKNWIRADDHALRSLMILQKNLPNIWCCLWYLEANRNLAGSRRWKWEIYKGNWRYEIPDFGAIRQDKR